MVHADPGVLGRGDWGVLAPERLLGAGRIPHRDHPFRFAGKILRSG